MKPKSKLSAEQIRAMLKNSALWQDRLRSEANLRGAKLTSVAPISDVITFLRLDIA